MAKIAVGPGGGQSQEQPSKFWGTMVAVLAIFLLFLLALSGSAPGGGVALHAKAARAVGVGPAGATGAGESLIPPQPSQKSFLRVQADPSLVQQEPAPLDEFVAAPWLLPPNTPGLPYAGVHQLDKLLALRATAEGSFNKTIALVPFSLPFVELLQNCIYSLVKFGEVRNYIVLTWTPADLAACKHMNLPCADVSSMLPGKLQNDPGTFGSHDYQVITWLKPIVVEYVLKKGYVVLMSDADTSWSYKPVWQSFLDMAQVSVADGVFQREWPLNTGVYLMLPTPSALHFMKLWVNGSTQAIKENTNDQAVANRLEMKCYITCQMTGQCIHYRNEFGTDRTNGGNNQTFALFRTFMAAHFTMIPDNSCGLADFNFIPRVDPCDWPSLFVHTTCIPSADRKAEALRRTQWWYMDSEENKPCVPRNGTGSTVPICQPRQWRLPRTEYRLYNCDEQISELALVHPGMLVPSPPPPAEERP